MLGSFITLYCSIRFLLFICKSTAVLSLICGDNFYFTFHKCLNAVKNHILHYVIRSIRGPDRSWSGEGEEEMSLVSDVALIFLLRLSLSLLSCKPISWNLSRFNNWGREWCRFTSIYRLRGSPERNTHSHITHFHRHIKHARTRTRATRAESEDNRTRLSLGQCY